MAAQIAAAPSTMSRSGSVANRVPKLKWIMARPLMQQSRAAVAISPFICGMLISPS